MHLVVVTSCTGEKAVDHERALTRSDFEQGGDHLARRERELFGLLTDAEQLYTGQQHARLMRGVRAFRERHSGQDAEHSLDLWILSAGYGLVAGDRKLAPYECTFQGMRKEELHLWAQHLNVPADIRRILERPYDLALLLLGDSYLRACDLDQEVRLGGPTLLLCGKGAARALPTVENLHIVVLEQSDTRRFSAGLVGLKGELGARVLERLSAEEGLITALQDPGTDVLSVLDDGRSRRVPREARPNPDVDWTIRIPNSWHQRPHRKHLLYFIPDKDDLVDPDYDFESDTHSGGVGTWSNQVFAHQLYPEPNYDGILVSKSNEKRESKKARRVNELGIHRYLRVPPEFPVMADCGAFSYINEDVPPYTIPEILDYYTRCGFNYGVSLDHITIGDEEEKRRRYELTLRNAKEFLAEHSARGLAWTPVGAVQGWNPNTYAEAARQYVEWGYHYLALGSLVRAKTPKIFAILEAVHRAVPKDKGVKIHLLGVARLDAIKEFVRLGVTSVDSASYLRTAWASSTHNYMTLDGWYSAIRIPQSDASYQAKRIMDRGLRSAKQLRELETRCLDGIRRYASSQGSPPNDLVDVLTEYDLLVVGNDGAKNPARTRARILGTLEARPWEKCECAVCRRWGAEVIIFRGNNRNRRRGFHNTYVFFKLLDRLFEEEAPEQLSLFPGH